MRLGDIQRRLARLENMSSASEALLGFEDGSTRAIRLRDPLETLLGAFRRTHARLEGQTIEPDATLALLASAKTVWPAEDSLLQLLREQCHYALEQVDIPAEG